MCTVNVKDSQALVSLHRDYVIIFTEVLMYTFVVAVVVVLVKRGVLTLVGEIQHYRNDRCYY